MKHRVPIAIGLLVAFVAGAWALLAPPDLPDLGPSLRAAVPEAAADVRRSASSVPAGLGAASVLAIVPDHAALKDLAKVGVIAPHAPGGDCHYEVRAFAAAVGIPEDPVTGSLNASLAQWLIGDGIAPARDGAAQGSCLGRAGRVFIEQEGDTVWVGGGSVSCIRGEVAL